jgi:putative hemolysin
LILNITFSHIWYFPEYAPLVTISNAMHPDLFFHCSIVLILILLSFILTLTKVALVVESRFEDRSNRPSRLNRAARSELLTGVRSGLTLVLVLAGAYSGWYLREPLAIMMQSALITGNAPKEPITTGTFAILVFLITGAMVTFGDAIPRRLALRYPSIIFRITSPIADGLHYLLRHFIRTSDSISNAILPRLSSEDGDITPLVTEEEVRIVLDRARESGLIHPAEQRIVAKVFRFGSRYVSSLMTPRNDIVWLDCDEPLNELWQAARQSGFSHFPVMRGSIDDVVGIVSIGDLAEQITAGRQVLDLSHCREPYQVPATSPALSVLQRFQEDKHRFALVIDEYGGIDGLITTHDLMEALVGEIGDSEFASESTIVKREDGSFLVDASIDLEDMMERIGIRLPIERERKGFYSLGGLIMERLGNVPRTGERFSFGDIDFEVVDMDGYRIDKVLIKGEQLHLSNSVANSPERRRSQAISQATRQATHNDSVHLRKKLKKVVG